MQIRAWYGDWYSAPEPTVGAGLTEGQPDSAAPEPRPMLGPPARMPATGLVMGRFNPLHKGHEYLLRFATANCRKLTVVLRSQPSDIVPAPLRLDWLKEICPKARLLVQPGWPDMAAWLDAVRQRVGQPEVLFSSQPEALQTARQWGSAFFCLDQERASVPVSGSAVRRSWRAQWSYLPDVVRGTLALRVALVGPEASGKSTLAAFLGGHFRTPVVGEMARAWTRLPEAQMARDVFPALARAQKGAEEALSRQANAVLICDTDVGMAGDWMVRMHGQSNSKLQEMSAQCSYHLHLLCSAQPPRPEAERFEQAIRQRLEAEGRRVVALSGDLERDMLPAAIRATEALLAEPRYGASAPAVSTSPA